MMTSAFQRFPCTPWSRQRPGLQTLQYAILAAILVVLIVIVQLHEQAGNFRKKTKQDIQLLSSSRRSDKDAAAKMNVVNTTVLQNRLSDVHNDESIQHRPNFCNFSHLRSCDFTIPDPDPLSNHIISAAGGTTCMKHGTQQIQAERCLCKKGWYGKACSIPDCVQHSGQLQEINQLTIRKNLRRVIYAAPFNIEFEMLEVLLNELCDLVDVFLIAESPFSAFGIRKPVRLLPKLHRRYLHECQRKIVYLYMDHFPLGGRKDGWVADSYIRSYVGMKGLRHVHNARSDDLFLVFDLDEVPSRDALLFLKTHDGFPEPFGFRLRWSIFGFYWKHDRYTQIVGGCTLGMLTQVHRNMSNQIRDLQHGITENRSPELNNYRRNHRVRPWFLGELNHYAGWHCSSCMDIHGIKVKFISAQNGDYPRWGSSHDKMDLNHIRSMVRDGKWFDGSKFSPKVNMKDDPFFAPSYVLKNYERYKHLLVHEHDHHPSGPTLIQHAQ